MKWELYKPPPKQLDYKGRGFRLDLSFGNVLRYIDLCENPDGMSDNDIVEIGFHWLVKTRQRLTLDDKSAIIAEIMSKFINPPQRKLNKPDEPQPVVDFNADSGYIYASFMQVYGVDLYDMAQTLPWCKFISLFNGLPEDCIIRQIMQIRARKIPAATKTNLAEIQRLTELKVLYALPSKQTPEDTKNAWNKLFDALERQVR